MHTQLISSGWQFRQTPRGADKVDDFEGAEGTAAWSACSKFPTSVHVELLKQGKIPDPYKGLNEWAVQWIQEADWEFRTTFHNEAEAGPGDLVFDGLDTYCDVYLLVASTNNMFIPHRVPVELREGDNTLRLAFKSPWFAAKEEEAANGGKRAVWNGDGNRLYSRKAQYGWGWDWGPIMMTVGPWRAVRLERYTHRFKDVRVDADLGGEEWTEGTLKCAIQSSEGFAGAIRAKLSLAGKVVKEDTVSKDFHWTLDVQGWYPRGYGKQPLYELELVMLDNGEEIDKSTTRVAFRHARVVQEPLIDQEGTTFLFEVNGVRVFCGGSNWIPADSFLTEITPERYRAWVDLLVRGNQNMLRVWGGGVYEHEALYDACDELGVLVWQDFMFGCGMYPSYPAINDNIKIEAEAVVRRLRNHPSVVIFAGNNEDYQVAESLGVMDYSDESGDYMKSKFPARQIYEVILPEVVAHLSTIDYHRSSPYGGKDTRDKTVGDIHQWNVWHGTQEPWANWDILGGRFISEFGMQGYPNMRTIKEWDDDPAQLFPQSRVSVNHNKADGFERRLELYLMENFRHAFDMPSYVYYTQAMQAECLAAAYRLWRRNWKGRGREYTAGALVWQINDCWPCVSWAIADYYLRPKAAFYAIARELEPYTVGMARKEVRTGESEAVYELNQHLELWGCNSTLEARSVRVELVSCDLEQGEVDRRSFSVELAPNSSTEIWAGTVPGQPAYTKARPPRPIVVQARLFAADAADGDSTHVLARYSNWPEPWKYLVFPEPNLRVTARGEEVTLECDKPIKGVILDVDDGDADAEGRKDEVQWSDQALDLFPGDPQVVRAKGLGGRRVRARYIGDGSA